MQLQSRPGAINSGQVPHTAITPCYVLILLCEEVTQEAVAAPLHCTPSPGHLVLVIPYCLYITEVCQWF